MDYLDGMKKWAKDGNVILAKIPGGHGIFGKGRHPCSFKHQNCSLCDKIDSCIIWDIKNNIWVNVCSSCLQKTWPKE